MYILWANRKNKRVDEAIKRCIQPNRKHRRDITRILIEYLPARTLLLEETEYSLNLCMWFQQKYGIENIRYFKAEEVKIGLWWNEVNSSPSP